MKLYELCLVPVLLAGAVSTMQLQTNVQKDSVGGYVQALSCETGPGVGVKASTLGLYAIEGHYGFTYKPGMFTFSVLPKLGLSYGTSAYRHELPQTVQFSLGALALVGYEQYRVGLEYWHMSNGDALGLSLTNKQNIGLDTVAFTVGFSF